MSKASGDAPTPEVLARLAEERGLGKLLADYPEEFRNAYAFSRKMTAGVARPGSIADEPAHVFRPGEERGE